MRKLWPVLTLGAVLIVCAFVPAGSLVRAQISESGDLSIELIDPKVLRVCSDPRNMPFSNQKGEGFENKLAELLAQKLGKSLAYAWYPQAPGFVRNTLGAYKCDVIMGYPMTSCRARIPITARPMRSSSSRRTGSTAPTPSPTRA
jgi:hypothetical protein